MAVQFHVRDDALQAFSDDVGALWCRPVAVIDCPDSFLFLRGKDPTCVSDKADAFETSVNFNLLRVATAFPESQIMFVLMCRASSRMQYHPMLVVR